MHSPDRQRVVILQVLREHRKLRNSLQKALDQHRGAACLRWPFAKAYRPRTGREPDAAQAAAIEWRRQLGATMRRTADLYVGFGDDRVAELFPLIDFDSGGLNGRECHWVFDALESQAGVLKARAKGLQDQARKRLPGGARGPRAQAVGRKPSRKPDRTTQRSEDAALMTVAEAAEILKLKKWRVYELCRQDAIPGVVRIGRQIRIQRTKLAAFIEGGGARLPGGWRKELE